ncbi:hypothetical protein HRbin28_00117 [bacterium HR28]|nr:hypothetical protein HRbin28_00117 [bacterium HR28]
MSGLGRVSGPSCSVVTALGSLCFPRLDTEDCRSIIDRVALTLLIRFVGRWCLPSSVLLRSLYAELLFLLPRRLPVQPCAQVGAELRFESGLAVVTLETGRSTRRPGMRSSPRGAGTSCLRHRRARATQGVARIQRSCFIPVKRCRTVCRTGAVRKNTF